MGRHANLVEQAMELAYARVDLLRQVTCVHGVHSEGGKRGEKSVENWSKLRVLSVAKSETRESNGIDWNVVFWCLSRGDVLLLKVAGGYRWYCSVKSNRYWALFTF